MLNRNTEDNNLAFSVNHIIVRSSVVTCMETYSTKSVCLYICLECKIGGNKELGPQSY